VWAVGMGGLVALALAAASVVDDDGFRDFAVKSSERMLLVCYKPGLGVAHYYDGEAHVRGLLADQFAMTAACLDAFDVTGNVVYEMMAEELGHYAMRTMFDESGGGFFDRETSVDEETIGLMRRPLKPFVTNCDAARTLVRLASASGEQDFVRAADRTIETM